MTTHKRRAVAVLSALTVVLGLLVGVQSPASAAREDCGAGSFCLWEHINFGGVRFSIGGSWAPGTCWNLPPSINNKASSAYNRMGREVQMWNNADCGVWFDELDPGRWNHDFRYRPGTNDTFSSIKVL
jgi:hypothetical protein